MLSSFEPPSGDGGASFVVRPRAGQGRIAAPGGVGLRRLLATWLFLAMLLPVAAGGIPLHFPGQITVTMPDPTSAVVGIDLIPGDELEIVVGQNDGYVAMVQHTGNGQFRATGFFLLGGQVVDLVAVPLTGTRGEGVAVLTANPDRVVVLEYVGGLEVFRVLASIELDEDPGKMALGDIGPNGEPALAVTLPGSDRWLLVYQDGSDWTLAQEIPSGDRPSSVAVLNLDADPVPEVVTGDNGFLSLAFSVFDQDDQGRFFLAKQIPAAGSPVALFPFDQDDDSVEELFVAYSDSAYLSVYEPQGGGLSESERIYTAIPSDGIVAATLAGGGKAVWCWNTLRGIVHYYRRQTVEWNYLESYYCGGRAADLALQDINNDSLWDLAVATGLAESLALLFGNNNPSYRAYLAALLPASSASGLVYDEDFDGHLDYVVACFGSSTLEFLRGDGQGHLALAPQHVVLDSAPWFLAQLFADDDNLPDLAIVQPNANRVKILRRLPGGGYSDLSTVATGGGPFDVNVADFDGDGWFDMAIGNEASDDITIAYGAGDGTFPDVRPLPMAGELFDLIAVKLDGDDLTDLVISNGQSSVGTIKNLGSRVFGQMRFYNVGGGTGSLGVADFDDDGDDDVVVAKEEDEGLAFLENLGNGALAVQVITHPLEARPGRLVTGDMNLDGLPDVVATLPDSRRIAVVLNAIGWVFTPPVRFTSALEPLAVDVGDFNEDQIPDLVTLDQALKLALMMLNIEPNPVAVEPAVLTVRCRGSHIEVRCPPFGDQAWRLEGLTAAGWTVLAAGSTASFGRLASGADGTVLQLTAADVADAHLAAGAEGSWSFRLRSPLSERTVATAQLSADCLAADRTVPEPLVEVDVPHPNPFNPRVRVRFRLADPEWVRSGVWDLTGRKVCDLGGRRYGAGEHLLEWDGESDRGPVGAGTYLVTLEIGDRRYSRKVTLVK